MYIKQKNSNVIKYQKNCWVNKHSDLGFKSHYGYIIDNQRMKTFRQRGETYQISQIPEMLRSVGKIRYGLRAILECGGGRKKQKRGRAHKRSLFNKKFNL